MTLSNLHQFWFSSSWLHRIIVHHCQKRIFLLRRQEFEHNLLHMLTYKGRLNHVSSLLHSWQYFLLSFCWFHSFSSFEQRGFFRCLFYWIDMRRKTLLAVRKTLVSWFILIMKCCFYVKLHLKLDKSTLSLGTCISMFLYVRL